MSGLVGIASTLFSASPEIPLVAATAKTVLHLTAPANHRVKVLGFGVFFDGTNTAAAPVVVKIVRCSSGTYTAVTPANVGAIASETLQSTAGCNASAEPSITDTLDIILVHPQQGYENKYPMGQEIIIPGGGRIGIVCTADAVVNVTAKIIFEE